MNLYWWMCGTILWNYKRVILWFELWFELLERLCWLELWQCEILIRTQNILQFGWGMDQKSLKRNYNESLATSLLEILCSSRSSCSFFFEGLWWKFFSALEAWIHRVSLICGLLRFLEAFKLDSSELWDLGMWFGWFLFECFSYLKVCGGSSSGFWRLESVEPRWFMVCWGFWRLLSLIPVTFEI